MPVQVYTSTPIGASAPEGATPKTAGQKDGEESTASPVTATATTTATTSPEQHGSHPAQPGARPHLPAQTGVPQSPSSSRYQPTQTQPAPHSPPPPQPGAVPSPVTGRSLPQIPPPPPPPPKTGEKMPPLSSSSAYPVSYTPRFAHGAAQQSYPGEDGSDRADFSHPPGYQQNAHAADFNSAQIAAHHSSGQGSAYGGEEESMWDMAKKWAAAAGETLVAAENEIWRRINKD